MYVYVSSFFFLSDYIVIYISGDGMRLLSGGDCGGGGWPQANQVIKQDTIYQRHVCAPPTATAAAHGGGDCSPALGRRVGVAVRVSLHVLHFHWSDRSIFLDLIELLIFFHQMQIQMHLLSSGMGGDCDARWLVQVHVQHMISFCNFWFIKGSTTCGKLISLIYLLLHRRCVTRLQMHLHI